MSLFNQDVKVNILGYNTHLFSHFIAVLIILFDTKCVISAVNTVLQFC